MEHHKIGGRKNVRIGLLKGVLWNYVNWIWQGHFNRQHTAGMETCMRHTHTQMLSILA